MKTLDVYARIYKTGIIEFSWIGDYREHKSYSGYTFKEATKAFKESMKKDFPKTKIEIVEITEY